MYTHRRRLRQGQHYRDLAHLGTGHRATVKFLRKQANYIKEHPEIVKGGDSDRITWQVALMMPDDNQEEWSNLKAAVGLQKREWAATAKRESTET